MYGKNTWIIEYLFTIFIFIFVLYIAHAVPDSLPEVVAPSSHDLWLILLFNLIRLLWFLLFLGSWPCRFLYNMIIGGVTMKKK